MAHTALIELNRLNKLYAAALRKVEAITAAPYKYTPADLKDARAELRSITASITWQTTAAAHKTDAAAVLMVRATPSMRVTPHYAHLAPPANKQPPLPTSTTPTPTTRRGAPRG